MMAESLAKGDAKLMTRSLGITHHSVVPQLCYTDVLTSVSYKYTTGNFCTVTSSWYHYHMGSLFGAQVSL